LANGYANAVAAHDDAVAQSQNGEISYEARVAAYRQVQAEYAAARARWEADVAACNAGDYSRCAPSPGPK